MESSHVTHCVSMGLRSLDLGMDIHAPTPFETADDLRLPCITYMGGINPFFAGNKYVERTRECIVSGRIKGKSLTKLSMKSFIISGVISFAMLSSI